MPTSTENSLIELIQENTTALNKLAAKQDKLFMALIGLGVESFVGIQLFRPGVVPAVQETDEISFITEI